MRAQEEPRGRDYREAITFFKWLATASNAIRASSVSRDALSAFNLAALFLHRRRMAAATLRARASRLLGLRRIASFAALRPALTNQATIPVSVDRRTRSRSLDHAFFRAPSMQHYCNVSM